MLSATPCALAPNAIALVRWDVLNDEVVELLLDRAKTIFNRYSYMFSAATYSTSIVGKNDFQFIFSSVESAVLCGRTPEA
jgi:hypothetical protein